MTAPEATEPAIGNYVIESSLASGSMGTVYVARHALTHAKVALKVLRADVTSGEQGEERFLREVRAAAHIGHDGIVRVHDAGRSHDGRMYLAMELLEGETLQARMQRLPGERLTTLHWLLAVLEPLAAAHAQGTVHRDLKPANVFIARQPDGSERVKLLDFGLARDTSEKSVTATGIAVGTPYYMSPEQATEPRKVSAPSDVWSFGVMLYEALCGAMPFDGETLHAVVIAASVSPHVPASQRAPELDARLTALVDECLDKRADHRPRDAQALRDRLAPLIDDPGVHAQLERPVKVQPRRHADETTGEAERMPFAETAISRTPEELRNAATRPSERGTSLWLALVALALATGGFFWLLERRQQAEKLEAATVVQTPRESASGASERKRKPRNKPAASKPAAAPIEAAPPAPTPVPSLPPPPAPSEPAAIEAPAAAPPPAPEPADGPP